MNWSNDGCIGSFTARAPAEGEMARRRRADRLSAVNLIRSPLGEQSPGVDVLSDFWTGTTTQAGDLFSSLAGLVTSNRACVAA
jgi:hypothetical protein